MSLAVTCERQLGRFARNQASDAHAAEGRERGNVVRKQNDRRNGDGTWGQLGVGICRFQSRKNPLLSWPLPSLRPTTKKQKVTQIICRERCPSETVEPSS